MSENLDKIKEKLEKLLKHQQSAEEIGNLEEAATFAAKAQELMAKYNIESFELREEKASDHIEGEKVNFTKEYGWSKSQGDWMESLYGIVARYNLCDIVISDTYAYPKDKEGRPDYSKRIQKQNQIYIIGEPINIEMVKYICSQLIHRLKPMQARAWKEYTGYEKKGSFRRGYFRGAVIAIDNKMHDQQVRNKQEYEGMTGLIKLTEVAIEEKKTEMFGELKNKSSRGLSSSSGRDKGYSDGSKMDINKGLGKGSGGSSKLLQ